MSQKSPKILAILVKKAIKAGCKGIAAERQNLQLDIQQQFVNKTSKAFAEVIKAYDVQYPRDLIIHENLASMVLSTYRENPIILKPGKDY